MTALELMTRLRGRGEEIEKLNEMLSIRRDAAMRVTSRPPDSVGGGGGGEDSMARYAAQIDELLTSVARVKQLWQAEMDACIKLSDRLQGTKKKLFYSYYAKSWTLYHISKHLGISEGYVRKLKVQVDGELEKMTISPGMLPEWYDSEATGR